MVGGKKTMNILCKLGIHIGCRKAHFAKLIIEFGVNGTKEEARKELEEILPGIKSKLSDYLEKYPIIISIK